jgi:hypothetical protein
MGDAAVAIVFLSAPCAIIGKALDHLIAASRADLHEFGETDHSRDDFGGGGVFDPAGTLFGNGIIDRQDLNEEVFEGLMAKDDIFSHYFPLIRQGNGFVGGIIDEASFREGAERLGHRGPTDIETGGYFLASGNQLGFNYMIYGLDVIFEAGTEVRFSFHIDLLEKNGYGDLVTSAGCNRRLHRTLSDKVT